MNSLTKKITFFLEKNDAGFALFSCSRFNILLIEQHLSFQWIGGPR